MNKNFIKKIKKNKTNKFSKASYLINKFKNNEKILIKILHKVYENNKDWWNWKSNNTAKKESKQVAEDIMSNKLDKGTQTTISSLYFALRVLENKIDPLEGLKNIHLHWAYITYDYENGIKEKRKNQFIPFDKLSNKEKFKDLDWIYAMSKYYI